MLFSKKGKLKREFDERLINQYVETKQELTKALKLENLSDDYDLYIITERKIAECKHLFLLREARIRKVEMK